MTVSFQWILTQYQQLRTIHMPRKGRLLSGKPMGNGDQAFDLDLEAIKRLARIGCTRKEIAAMLDIDVTTLYLHERRNPLISDIIEKGLEQGRAHLRRWQHKAARRGQNAMLIWLGKQLLGQTEKVDPRTLSPEQAALDLSRLSDEEYSQYRVLVSKAQGEDEGPSKYEEQDVLDSVALRSPEEKQE
jgi:hypothetical protein